MKPTLESSIMEKLVSLCKRRGFVFPNSEIYGGLGSTWDYGPIGVELKRNIKNQWWKSIVQDRQDIIGLDTAILMHPQVWEASGHVKEFTDPLVECKVCHVRYRADDPSVKTNQCPVDLGALTPPRQFNLMFKTFMGAVEDSSHQVWLRPETAQGIFVNFETLMNSSRRKLPMGVAQIGKAFRNEITPGNFIFRTREFEQMEIEYFVPPGTDEQWHQHWIEDRLSWYRSLGIKDNNLRLRRHEPDELAHYAKACYDIEYRFPWGWAELEGIANRTDFDLRSHSDSSGKDLSYFDHEMGQHYYPYVIEPSGGVDRATLAFLIDAYDEEPESDKNTLRTVLHFHPSIVPFKVAVLPLSRNEKLIPIARALWDQIRPHFTSLYDDAQSIGRRYRRQDEIGTLYSVTIDFQSLEDNKVTIRDRDTMYQIRTPISELISTLQLALSAGWPTVESLFPRIE